MIPPAIRFTTRFYVTAALIAAAFFFGSTCGQRDATGDALRQHKADSTRYVQTRDSLVREVLDAETQRILAEARAANIAARSDSLARAIRHAAPPRIAIVPRDSSVMVDVCIAADSACYPAHRRVAEVAATLDSLVHVEVFGKLIPSIETERQAWKDALHKANVERRLENELRRAAEARVTQLERTVAQLQPSKAKKAGTVIRVAAEGAICGAVGALATPILGAACLGTLEGAWQVAR